MILLLLLSFDCFQAFHLRHCSPCQCSLPSRTADTQGQTFVSKFVAHKLAAKMDSRFLEMAQAQTQTLNPSVNGFMFEYWVISRLRANGLYVCVNKVTTFSAHGVFRPCPLECKFVDWKPQNGCKFFGYPGEQKPDHYPCWLVPTKWNQGCFDIVYAEDPYTLRLVQVTRSDSHSLKWMYVRELMKWLGITTHDARPRVEYATLKPGNCHTFAVTLQEFGRKPSGQFEFRHYLAEKTW